MIVVGTLLHRNKTELLNRVLRQAWAAYSWPDQPMLWVAADNDADDEARDALVSATGHNVEFVQADMEGLRPAVGPNHPRYMTHGNQDHLKKMARLREAVRVRAIKILEEQEPDPAERYLLWHDCDTEAPTQGVNWLLETLNATTGPLAPRIVSGIYCDRTCGAGIAQYWRGNPEAATLYPARITPVGFIGMGFMLMRADTAAAVSWEDFERGASRYTLGEDVYFCWHVERAFGPPCYLDGRVLCRHYQDNGFCWQWQVNERNELVSAANDKFCFEERSEDIFWIGRDGAVTDKLGMVRVNQHFRVSPEVATWMIDSGFFDREPLMVQR